MPASFYIPAASEHIDVAKDFLNFVASPEGCDIITQTIGAIGPYMVEGCELPPDVPKAVSDMLPYFETEGATGPALEYLSPIKGPALEQITVEVGSGIRSAADAAALYDQDVEKQAKQLGLPDGDHPQPTKSPPLIEGRAAARGTAVRRRSPYPYWFVLPGAVVFAVLFLAPTFASFWFSLTRWDLFTASFIGLENFRQFFSEPFLLQGLVNTLIYAVVTSGTKTVIGLLARGPADVRHLRAGLPANGHLLPRPRLVHRRRLHLHRADAPDPRCDQRRARGDRDRRSGLARPTPRSRSTRSRSSTSGRASGSPP